MKKIKYLIWFLYVFGFLSCETYQWEDITEIKTEKEVNNMAKVLSEYTVADKTFTASEIDTRRSTAIGDAAVVGTTLEVVEIKMSDIRDVLGVSTLKLSELAKSAQVNQWSTFNPKEITTVIVAGPTNELSFSDAPPYAMGEFAGYNHTAITPGLSSPNTSEGETKIVEGCVEPGTNPIISFDISLGEFDFSKYYGTANQIQVTLEQTDGSVLLTKELPFNLFYKRNGDEVYLGASDNLVIDISGWADGDSHPFVMKAAFVYNDGTNINHRLNVPNSTLTFSVQSVINQPQAAYLDAAMPWQEDTAGCPTYSGGGAHYVTKAYNFNNYNTWIELTGVSVEYAPGDYSTSPYNVWFRVTKEGQSTPAWTEVAGISGNLQGSSGVSLNFDLGEPVTCGDTVDIRIGYEGLLCPDYSPN